MNRYWCEDIFIFFSKSRLVYNTGVFIVGAKRTPFGTHGGKLTNTHITDLQTIAAKAALAAGNVDPKLVDSVNIGNVIAASATDGIFLPRHVLLKSGIPKEKIALGVNRLCGSGFQSILNSTQDILTGLSKISLAGGVENMSAAPFVIRNIRNGISLGADIKLEDYFWLGGVDSFCGLSMGLTAEKLGEQFNITRDEIDDFALRSQQLWKKAQDEGRFKEELVPVPVKDKKQGTVNFEVDEHPRPWTTLEALKKLPSVFKKNGLVTAGSASGIADGSGALVLASEEAVKEHGLKPLARIVGFSVVGVEPTIMGIGPSPAIKQLLQTTGKTLNDIDLVDINEAFVAQALACQKDLNLDIDKFNVNGGATAIGHPLGATGARITTHLVHELRRREAKFGIGSACIGGGQGIAVMIENTA